MTNYEHGIEVGEFLGGGAYSSVFEHPSDPNKVIMFGQYSDDMLKLNLFNAIGALHSVILLAHDRHASTLTRFGSNHDSGTYETLCDASRLFDRLLDDSRSRESFLWELGTNPAFSPNTALICSFLVKTGLTEWGNDCKPDNWLIAPDGKAMPLDVFNGAWGVDHLSEVLTEKISDKITDKTSEES